MVTFTTRSSQVIRVDFTNKLKGLKNKTELWLVCISGLSSGLRTKGSPFRFPVRAHAWVVGQVPSRGC